MGSIEDGLNRIVEAITPRGLGGHGPRKVKVYVHTCLYLCSRMSFSTSLLVFLLLHPGGNKRKLLSTFYLFIYLLFFSR